MTTYSVTHTVCSLLKVADGSSKQIRVKI